MELLMSLGAASASVSASESGGEEASAILRATALDDVPLWERAAVTALFDAGVDLAMIGDIVRDAFDLPGAPVLDPVPVEDLDWVVHVQQSWKPQRLGQGFEVRLPWHDGKEGGARGPDGRVVIRMEGGEAFGLGDHPTTQGGAAFLERRVPALASSGEGLRVLDYGSGSGVLAVCAALLGATAVLGVDVDARAVAAARRNAALNLPQGAGAGRAEFREGPEDFGEAADFASAILEEHGTFDLVVANILRRPLVGLAPALSMLARPGATLALTGLREELGDFDAICAAYEPSFGDFRRVELDQGWLLIEATRL